MRAQFALVISAVFLCACETENESTSPITCAVGTTLNVETSACVPTLGDGVELTSEGTIQPVVDPSAETVEAA